MLLVLGLLLFVGLVVFHEFGHFIAARRNGVEVEEFGIGFPPRAKVFGRKKGTVYTLNWLPLGGFVKLKGEHDDDRAPGSFGAASLKTKVKIMLAGVALNLLAAFVLLTLGAWIGLPQLMPNQFTVASDSKLTRQEVYVGFVEKGSPAEKAGLKERDQLLSLTAAGKEYRLDQADDLPALTKQFANQPVSLEFKRGSESQTVNVNLRSKIDVEASKKSGQPKGYLGISPTAFSLRRSTWSAPIVAAGVMKQYSLEMLKGIGTAFRDLVGGQVAKASDQVAGPVGIFVLIKDGSFLGPEFIIFIIGVLSLTLAVMNLLPIPALDGGRLFVTLLFRALKKPLTKNIEDKIHGFGFIALLILFVLITIVDVKRSF